METLEKTQGWKEADFDQVLQYLRTVLLRRMCRAILGYENTSDLNRRRFLSLYDT
jgi:dynein light intermediate chain 1, cytosolic